jgi:oligoribonuclease NrnB/cAMP/cGMP phosphodiesterase (DHH superfamily)
MSKAKRIVVFPRLQKKVEYVALCHPRVFEKMTNAQIRYDVWKTFHSHVDSWCEYPLTLNSVSKAKMAVKRKIKEIKNDKEYIQKRLSLENVAKEIIKSEKAELYDEIPNYLKPLLRKI